MLQAFQSVKVTNPKLDAAGQVGRVVSDDGKTVTVEMANGEHLTFKAADLQAL